MDQVCSRFINLALLVPDPVNKEINKKDKYCKSDPQLVENLLHLQRYFDELMLAPWIRDLIELKDGSGSILMLNRVQFFRYGDFGFLYVFPNPVSLPAGFSEKN